MGDEPMYLIRSIPKFTPLGNKPIRITNKDDILAGLLIVGLMGLLTRGPYRMLYVDGKPWTWVRAEAQIRFRALGFRVSKTRLNSVILELEKEIIGKG